MERIRTIHRIRRTSKSDTKTPAMMNWTGRAMPAPAVVKNHGDKLSEAFKKW